MDIKKILFLVAGLLIILFGFFPEFMAIIYLIFPVIMGTGYILYSLLSYLYEGLLSTPKENEEIDQQKQERRSLWFYNLWLPLVIFTPSFVLYYAITGGRRVSNRFFLELILENPWALYFILYTCYYFIYSAYLRMKHQNVYLNRKIFKISSLVLLSGSLISCVILTMVASSI